MRLLCVTPAIQDGGIERTVETVCAGAKALGWTVTVAIAEERESTHFRARLFADDLATVLGGVSPSPLAMATTATATFRLVEQARETEADVVWFALPRIGTACMERLALAAARYPVLSTVFYVDPNLQKKPWRWLLAKSWHVGLQQLTALDTVTHERLARALKLPEGRLKLTPPGSTRLSENAETRAVLRKRGRKEFGLEDDAFAVLTLARLEKQKAIEAIIDAAIITESTLANSLFLVAGDGSQRSILEAQATRAGVGHRIRFLGHREPEALLASADAFALPSRWEGVPLSIVEALDAELPVVASAVGGVPELLEHGNSGVLIPPACGRALAAALDLIAKSPVPKQELQRRAERARRLYSATTFTEQILEGLRRLAYDASERARTHRSIFGTE